MPAGGSTTSSRSLTNSLLPARLTRRRCAFKRRSEACAYRVRVHPDLAVVGEAAVVPAHKGRGPDKRALVGQTATFLQILLTLGEPTETGTGFLTVSSAECRSEFESGIAGHPGGCWRCVAGAEQLRGARR